MAWYNGVMMEHNQLNQQPKRCSKCGKKIKEKIIPAGANSEGYTTLIMAECPGSTKTECQGWLRIFFLGKETVSPNYMG